MCPRSPSAVSTGAPTSPTRNPAHTDTPVKVFLGVVGTPKLTTRREVPKSGTEVRRTRRPTRTSQSSGCRGPGHCRTRRVPCHTLQEVRSPGRWTSTRGTRPLESLKNPQDPNPRPWERLHSGSSRSRRLSEESGDSPFSWLMTGSLRTYSVPEVGRQVGCPSRVCGTPYTLPDPGTSRRGSGLETHGWTESHRTDVLTHLPRSRSYRHTTEPRAGKSHLSSVGNPRDGCDPGPGHPWSVRRDAGTDDQTSVTLRREPRRELGIRD